MVILFYQVGYKTLGVEIALQNGLLKQALTSMRNSCKQVSRNQLYQFIKLAESQKLVA